MESATGNADLFYMVLFSSSCQRPMNSLILRLQNLPTIPPGHPHYYPQPPIPPPHNVDKEIFRALYINFNALPFSSA